MPEKTIRPEDMQPPHNYESEQALLGGILTKNDLYYRCSVIVRPEDFADPLHGRIFDAIGILLNRGSAANFLTLKQFFQNDPGLDMSGGADYLLRLENATIPLFALTDYAEQVRELAVRRRAIADLQETLAELHQYNIDQSVTEIVGEALHKLEERRTEIGRKSIGSNAAANRVFTVYESPVAKYSTGIDCIDKSFHGGLHAGRLYGFGAYQKTGKTAFMGTIAQNLNRAGQKTLFVCLEVDSTEIMQRILAREIDKPAVGVMQGWADRDALANAVVTMPDNIVFEDAHGATMDDIAGMIVEAYLKHRIVGFFIDYWQLIQGQGAKQTEEKHLRDAANRIAAMCRRYGLWGMVPSQLNKLGSTFGGGGLLLASDWYGVLNRGQGSHGAWMEAQFCRYGAVTDAGEQDFPALHMHYNGPWFQDIDLVPTDQIAEKAS